MKKVIYIANARIPTEKAHGIQIMKTCEALALQGVELELWLPQRNNPDFQGIDPFEYYGVAKNFKIEFLPCRDTIGKFRFIPGLGYFLQSKSFARAVQRKLGQANYSDAVFYTRDTYPIVPVMNRGFKYFYEVHTLKERPNILTQKVIKKANGVLPITRGLAKKITSITNEVKIQVLPDGVDMKKFLNLLTKQQAREKLGLNQEVFSAVYTGHLYKWKGADTFLEATQINPKIFTGILVGGTEADVKEFKLRVARSKMKQVEVVGHRSPNEIPFWLAAADVLVLPNSGKFEISRSHTSPLKLFEYMAAERAIVASDLPSIREVLDDTCAKFFKPDDELSLSQAIVWVRKHTEDALRLAQEARKRVEEYSWEKRAEKIIKFIKSK